MPDEVLTIKEVAALLKLAEKTVYAMAQAGEIPAFKIRGQWRIKRISGSRGFGSGMRRPPQRQSRRLRSEGTRAQIRLRSRRLSWLAGPMSFPIQQQIHKDACIAASACSLLTWLQKQAPTQQALDPLIQEGMRAGNNGFDSLQAALATLRSSSSAQRFTPVDPAAWASATPSAAAGFLISHGVNLPSGIRAAHITVVFFDTGSWHQADPGTASVRAITLAQLQPDYAGDLAIII